VTIYLKDIDAHFAGMNSVWDKWLPKGVAPARATVEAKLCEPEILVEFSVTAAMP
jgi:enamine deaminase RidA (YjgF/YER057c/UK114 family)